MLVGLSMLKEQTTASLVSGCGLPRALQTEPLAVNTLNTCGSSCLDEVCKNTSKDIGNPKQVSSDINCKLHQPVLGVPSQERLASD